MDPFFDDERIADAEFFECAGFGDSAADRFHKRYELRDGVRVLGEACAGPECWKFFLYVGRQIVCNDPTRGHIRRLCRELRVPLLDLPIEPIKENPELPKQGKIEPDIPAIFAVIADFALSNGLAPEEVIDQVNAASSLDELGAASIKLRIVEHWRKVASNYPFPTPSELEIQRLRNKLRRLELRRDAVAAVAPFFR